MISAGKKWAEDEGRKAKKGGLKREEERQAECGRLSAH
jgi:hypothetical protein